MEKEGSTAGFILGLVGGILSMVLGAQMVAQAFLDQWAAGFLEQQMDKTAIITSFAIALYFLIIGVWILAAGTWMRKPEKLKLGAITALILGIISINPLAIVGGILGLVKNKQQIQPKNQIKATNKPRTTPINPPKKLIN